MKMTLRALLCLLVLTISANLAFAQPKIGYVSTDSLIKMLPEYDSAQKVMDRLQDKLAGQYQKMVNEYQTKESECQRHMEDPNVSPAIRDLCIQELTDMQKRIQAFQQQAQEDQVKKETALMTPIVDKIKKAIEDVAKEKGYTYVLDKSVGVILYSTPSDDLMADVKKKLGLK